MAKIDQETQIELLEALNSGKIDESVLEALGALDENRLSQALNGMRSDGLIGRKPESGPASFEVSNIKEEPNESWKSGGPKEVAQEIVNREGIGFQEAYERAVGFPRREMAILEGSEFPIASTAFDIASAPMRGVSAIASALGGGDPSEKMAQTKAAPSKGFWGGVDEFAQNVIIDPLTPIGGAIGSAVKTGVTKLLPNAGKATLGALEGLFSGGAEFGLEQAKRMETGEDLQGVSDFALQTGGGAVIGGAGGKLGDMMSPKVTGELSPRQEVRAAQKELSQIETDAIPDGVNPKLWEKITPMYRFGFNPNLKPERGELDFNNLLVIGKNAVENDEIDPLEYAFQEVGYPAYKAYSDVKSNVGKEIGAIRDQYLDNLPPISKEALLDGINEDLAFNRYVTKIAEIPLDGGGTSKEIRFFKRNGTPLSENIIPTPIKESLKFLDDMPDTMDGDDIELFRAHLKEIMPKDLVTQQPIKNAVNTTLGKINNRVKNNIDEGIATLAPPDVVQQFKAKRADYANLQKNEAMLGRLIGKDVPIEDGATTTKGSAAIDRVVKSLRDQGSKNVWNDVKQRTGYDVRRAGARALQAMSESGDARVPSRKMKKMDLNPVSVAWDLASKGVQKGVDFVNPKAMAALQVERQLKNAEPRSLFQEIPSDSYQSFGDVFAPYSASAGRSVVRDTYDENNKVSQNKLAIEADGFLKAANIGR